MPFDTLHFKPAPMPASDDKPHEYVLACTFDAETGGHQLTIVDSQVYSLSGIAQLPVEPSHSTPHFLDPGTPSDWKAYFCSPQFQQDIANRLVTVEMDFLEGAEPSFKITVWKKPPGGNGNGEGSDDRGGDGGDDMTPALKPPGSPTKPDQSSKDIEEEKDEDDKPPVQPNLPRKLPTKPIKKTTKTKKPPEPPPLT